VYVGGPKAAISAYMREEWQFALKCDHVVVTPILRLGDYEHVPGELSLLHCEDFRDDAKYDAALTKLIASLRQPNPKLGALFAVPSLPPNFLGRPDLMRRVRDALLVDLQKPQVITGADARVGMQGTRHHAAKCVFIQEFDFIRGASSQQFRLPADMGQRSSRRLSLTFVIVRINRVGISSGIGCELLTREIQPI
jgi:hypothetical protein